MKPIENKDFKTWRKDIPIFFNGKPFYGKAAFVNGYNGHTSNENDGCLCALIKDRRGVPSCWDDNGNPNSITNENGVPIRLKNRRGTSVELNGVLPVDYEDAYANGYNPTDFSIKPEKYGVDSYITGVFESKYKTNTNMNKKLIRLTESDLHRIVKQSVNKVLKEGVGDSVKIYNDLSGLLDKARDLSGELIDSAYNDGQKGLIRIATTIQNAL